MEDTGGMHSSPVIGPLADHGVSRRGLHRPGLKAIRRERGERRGTRTAEEPPPTIVLSVQCQNRTCWGAQRREKSRLGCRVLRLHTNASTTVRSRSTTRCPAWGRIAGGALWERSGSRRKSSDGGHTIGDAVHLKHISKLLSPRKHGRRKEMNHEMRL